MAEIREIIFHLGHENPKSDSKELSRPGSRDKAAAN
jgi:hypothetical protein